jgi:ATP-dependent DNA helicase RecG
MSDFRNGNTDILVSTSIIEVGIDNPNATWIVIEEADRFGLAQLHQLRGRVGRGEAASVCFLHNSLTTERATERLTALVAAKDGLAIAELDLQLRGPGEIAGTNQSGIPGIRYANLGNTQLVTHIYQQAEKIGSSTLEAYPELNEAVKRLLTNGLTPT